MPVLAGWFTGEQVPQEVIGQTLMTMREVLGRYGGQPMQTVMPGAGLVAFADAAYAIQQNDEPPVLDWVPDRRTLVYRRPLSGMHALYYIEDWPAQGNLLFASEIKALFAVGVPRRLHLAAIDALLRYGFIPAPWTAFKDIRVVPAGSILRWQRAKTIMNQAADYHLDEPPAADIGNNALDHLHTLLDEKSAGLLPTHEQLVALTDGDSSSALSTVLAAQHTSTAFTVAAIGYTKSTAGKAWKDAEHVAEVSERPFLAITGVDQPEFWTATLAGLEAPDVNARSLALHQLLHTVGEETGARVAISGLGAHCLLGATIEKTIEHSSTDIEAADILRWYGQTLTNKKIQELWSEEAAASLQGEERWEDTLHARKLARHAAQFSDRRQGWYYLDLHLRLPDAVVNPVQQLATQERMIVRSPYLHADVIDFLTRLPTMLNDGTRKDAILGKLAQRCVGDLTGTAAKLPLIAPTASLLHLTDSEMLQEVLSPAAVQALGIFNPAQVDELVKRKTVSRELVLVFTTQMLCQLFGMGI
ncbi:MAG TPA: asparagine synthase-related protein [Ktedonobacteraceae bacterium]|nr:asparagine synthase-related protein [Ktedonobacteraceae bacterium]